MPKLWHFPIRATENLATGKNLITLRNALQRLGQEAAVLVTVLDALGSVPRSSGTRMLVFADHFTATVGGGHLEFQAIAHARQMLAGHTSEQQVRHVLGPSLGQCCGGVVELGFERVGAADAQRVAQLLTPVRQPVALFGGGHVGRAIVQTLVTLPFAVRWIDSRDEIFPDTVPDGVVCEHSSPVQAAVTDLAPGSRVLIMSFSHAEDLDIVMACLRRIRERRDLPFVGLIGSKTKWATFRHRLEHRGFAPHEIDAITCPIGIPGIVGKEPEVIAIATAAQLLLL